MEQIFATKRDINGNRCVLRINHEAKRYYTTYFDIVHASDITATITRKKMRELCNELDENGYRTTLKIGYGEEI